MEKMLKCLRIRNFAIIDAVEVEFQSGLNIISGETGAGKSILMDALFLLLGGRASSDLVRSGAPEASVEALFELGGDSEILRALEAAGVPEEGGELLVRRVVQSSGKNRIFANGAMINAATLASITSRLVDLCSQHDQQLLTRADEQLLWIDRFGELEELRLTVKRAHEIWREKTLARAALEQDSQERGRRIDFLRFQLQELEEAELQSAQEDKEIEQELKTLSNAEALFQFSQEAETALLGGDGNESVPVGDTLGILLNKVRSLHGADPRLQPLLELLEGLKVGLDEASLFLRDYTRGLSRDEGKLDQLNARSALLAKLKRKYGPDLESVLKSREIFRTELSLLENHSESMQKAEAEEKIALEALTRFCADLSKKRLLAGKKFSLAVEKELAELNMEQARFAADFQSLESPTASGAESARFQISANPGEPLQPLHKIASGGELSRVMLAIHNVISAHGDVGVYLFDEVDAGIGGKTAAAVGSKIRRVARSNQVICITHLPQVACFADAHFRVEKRVTGKGESKRTSTSVAALDGNARVEELARMLGGLENDKTALANARAMLAKAKEMAPTARHARKPAERRA